MTDYLPEVYTQFDRRYPGAKEVFDSLGIPEHEAGPLGEKERRWIKLGVAVGGASRGGVRSHLPKLLGVGTCEEENPHAIDSSPATNSFPASHAALGWAEKVLAEESNGRE